jgi:small subunit ribosomal protein S2
MTESKEKTQKSHKPQKEDFGLNIEEMAAAGLHLGHKTSKTHPKMKIYVFGARNGIHMLDLEKTAEKIKEAFKFIENLLSENKKILLVGTKIQTKSLVKETGKECGLFYINERWLGGTFTNFETIKKRMTHFKDLESKKEKGELEKYTKKERAKIDKELKELERKFGGIKQLEKLPDAVFVLDLNKDILAVKEAVAKRIPVIAVTDADVDPSLVDYPIPANDDAVSSIRYILERLKNLVSLIGPKVKKEKEE